MGAKPWVDRFLRNLRDPSVVPSVVFLGSALVGWLWLDSIRFGLITGAFLACLIGFLRPVLRAWLRPEPPRPLPTTGPEPEPTPPLEVPRLARWWRRQKDRWNARKRRRQSGGYRSSTLPPRCIVCRYDLTGLPDYHTCPECGRPYTFTQIDAYFDDPGNC